MDDQRDRFARARQMLVDSINSGGDGAQIGEDLFGASDLLESDHALREALTDPSRDTRAKQQLIESVFGSRISGAAVEVMGALVALHWSSSRHFARAVGDMGLESCILMAMHGDEYDSLCQQLVDAMTLLSENRELRVQLSDIGEGSPKDRAALARKIFHGHVSHIAERLIVRAAFHAHYGHLVRTLRDYAERAAQATEKRLVIAYTAEPLTEEQYYRMAALAARRWDSAVLLTTVVQPSVIGGFLLDAGEQSVDTTVKTDIAAARLALVR